MSYNRSIKDRLINMQFIRYLLIIVSLLYLSFPAIAQKAGVSIVSMDDRNIYGWQILDGQYRLLCSENDFSGEDSIFISLEADTRYIFRVSFPEIAETGTLLYSLSINGEPVLLIKSDNEPGDHFYPFYTGIKKEVSKIIGGTDARISDYPWQVYYESGKYMCGGTIISDSWIITAAHCTMNDDGSEIPVSEMFIKAGATNPYNIMEGRKYLVTEAIVHENFDKVTLDNDIALLRLMVPIDVPNAKPVKLVTAADVAEGATDPGVISWVTGWGLTDLSPEVLPYTLQKVQLPIVSAVQAATVWSKIPDNVIMAGFRDGTRDACNGDSGGPLVVPLSGEYRLAGITSWGSEDCDTYSAYTRVSSYEPWIRTKTGIMEFIPPVPAGDTLICQGERYDNYTVSPVQGALEYQWELFPGNAGIINGNSTKGTVEWNQEYLGAATIKLRVIINGEISEWSRLNVVVTLPTRIINQPPDRVLCSGQTVDLGIAAEGHDLNYDWYKNNVLINSISTGEFRIPNSSVSNSGIYYCKITGSCGIVYTDNINVTVHPVTRINSISSDKTLDTGDDSSLEVIAEGHALSYEWKKDDEIIRGYDSYHLDITDANAADIGLYQTLVKGTCGDEMSSKIYVYVRKKADTPVPEILVWPTITDDVINTALSNDEIYSIRIYSYTGNIIKELHDCRFKTTVYMNNYPSGMYIINIYNRNFTRKQKFIRK